VALTVASILASAAASAADTPPADQSASSGGLLEEVTVTANKRGEQSVVDVPGAIQAISGDTLQRQGVSGFIDVATRIPGLQLQDLGPGDKKYIIRGINSVGDSTAGVYYDEAVISGSNANDGGGRQADIKLYDLERVEVLRGPQGTLYGASSMSGTIRFITNKPKLTGVEGYVTAEISDTEKGSQNYDANGAINLPIVDGTLAARVVGWSINDSGFIDQVRIPAGRVNNVNDDRTTGGRGMLRWAPTDDLDLVASITAQTTKSDGSSRYTPPGTMSFGDTDGGLPPVPGGDLLNTDLTRSPWTDEVHVFSLTGTYKLPTGTLTATANQFNRDMNFQFDSTPILISFGIPDPAQTIQPQSRDVQSDEIRYASASGGPVNFVVGGFYQREKSDFNVEVVRTNELGEIIGPFSPLNEEDALQHPGEGTTYFGRFDHRETKSYAGFGEVTWDVNDKLSLVAGARYYSATLDGKQGTTHPFGGFGPGDVDPPPNHDKFSKTTFKANASYKFADRQLVYFTFSQGFRGGGLNAADLPFASGIPRGFEPDELDNFEVGFKGRAGAALEYDVAAYYIDWTNIQVRQLDNTQAFPFIGNAGDARVTGLEGSVTARLGQYFSFIVSGSYQDAELTSDQPAIPGNDFTGRKGDKLPNVPKFQGSISADFTAPITNGLRGTLAADFSYRGDTDTQLRAVPENAGNVRLDSYGLLNLRAAIESDVWTTTLFVRNVGDKRAQIDAISTTQDPLALITVRPRTVGVSFTRRF
jgi:outer membrane receptor protein involved in Fe transport